MSQLNVLQTSQFAFKIWLNLILRHSAVAIALSTYWTIFWNIKIDKKYNLVLVWLDQSAWPSWVFCHRAGHWHPWLVSWPSKGGRGEVRGGGEVAMRPLTIICFRTLLHAWVSQLGHIYKPTGSCSRHMSLAALETSSIIAIKMFNNLVSKRSGDNFVPPNLLERWSPLNF